MSSSAITMKSPTTFTTNNWTLAIEPSWSYPTPSLSPSPSIPELPSWIILPLLLTATLVAVLARRKI